MFGVIVLDNFKLQAAMRWRNDLRNKAVALIDEQSKKSVIIELTEFAKEQGVSLGQSSAQGLAQCPFLTILPRVPSNESAIEDILLEIAFSYTPDVELTGTGCCTLDMRRVHTKEDWDTWCELIVEKFQLLTLDAEIGVGPNPDLAYLAAKQAISYSVVKKPEKFLSDIPISFINSDKDLQATLDSWGVHTIAEFTKLSYVDLSDRFGLQGKKLWQMATGKNMRVLKYAKQKQKFYEEIKFEHEVDKLEGLRFPTRRLLVTLIERLKIINRIVSKITLRFFLDGKPPHERIFTIPAPTNERLVLTRILRTYLEELKLEVPIIGMSLEVEPGERHYHQYTLFDTVVKDVGMFNETIARLRAIDGLVHVGVARRLDTHKPDSFKLEDPKFHIESKSKNTNIKLGIGIGPVLKRFRPTIPAKVELKDLVPVRLNSSRASGRITCCKGPFRLEGNWWGENTWAVEGWAVEIDSVNIFSIFKDKGCWYLAGCYDSNLC